MARKGQTGTSMITVRLRPPKEERPVDPDALSPEALRRREEYAAAQAERRKAAEAFVPANQRNLVRDDKGRLRNSRDVQHERRGLPITVTRRGR